MLFLVINADSSAYYSGHGNTARQIVDDPPPEVSKMARGNGSIEEDGSD